MTSMPIPCETDPSITGHGAEFRPSPEFAHFSIRKMGLVGAFENYGAESDILLEFSNGWHLQSFMPGEFRMML